MNKTKAKKQLTKAPALKKTEAPIKLLVDKDHPLTVNSLKDAGFKVSILHFRRISDVVKIKGLACEIKITHEMPLFEIQRRGFCDRIVSKGGYTTARVSIPATREFVIGEAFCHPDYDSYCKKKGIQNALQDALGKLKKAGLVQ